MTASLMLASPRLWRSLLAGLLVAMASTSIAAAAPRMPVSGSILPEAKDRTAAAATTPGVHSLTREDLSAWLDGLLPVALRQGDIAGGVVIVVKDGRVLFEKGYGYADVARRRPMDPARTIIRPGSISKLFIWTAVMQLVEQKRLALDVDVNRYLDFRIPDFAGRPITLRDIVTHRTGFEEQIKDIGGPSPPVALDRFVKTHLPARIYPAGQVPAYSNYASTLAAYIVQRVSGELFEDYVSRRILLPLNMRRSTFAQPVPAAWRDDVALGYLRASGPPQFYEYIGPFPAGGLNTTADDMGRFMLAHLELGQGDGHRIMAADTARAMHAPQSSLFPQLNTMATGFYETSRNGHRSIGHNGGTQFFHSDLHLLPDDGVGIFVSLNSAGLEEDTPAKIHNALFNGFMDRYFSNQPKPFDAGVSPSLARDHATLMQGYWESSRRPDESWFSLANLFSPFFVTADPDGGITIPFPARGMVHWTEIAPFLWRSDDGDKIRALTHDGQPVMIGIDVAPPAALLPVPWWRSPAWLVPAAGLSLAILFLYGVALPFGAAVRRIYATAKSPALGKLHHRAPKLLSLGLVAAAIAYPSILATFVADPTYLSGRTDWIILTLESITLTLLIITPVFVATATVRAWSTGLPWHQRIVGPIVLSAIAVFWWMAVAFDLVSFGTRY